MIDILNNSIRDNDLEKLKVVLKYGSFTEKELNTALQTAIINSRIDIIKYLVEEIKIDISYDNNFLAETCIVHNKIEELKYLKSKGVILTTKWWPIKILISEAMTSDTQMIDYLIEEKFDFHPFKENIEFLFNILKKLKEITDKETVLKDLCTFIVKEWELLDAQGIDVKNLGIAIDNLEMFITKWEKNENE